MSVSKEPLSIRNNNPGNLRFVGQPGATQGEGGFARFETPEAGLAAMRAQIELDTQTRGLTLDKFINKYAPPSENKTANYINFIAQKTGLDPRSTVPAERIGDVQRAMIEMEGGPRSASYFAGVTAQATPTPAQEPRTTVQTASAQLPMSYRVALAANYLGDTEKDSVTDQAMQLLEEIQGEDTGGGAGAVSKKLASILSPKESGVDPFAAMTKAQEENAPRRKPVPRMPKLMAEGGEATSDDRDLSDEDRQRMRAEQEGRAMGGLRYNLGPIMGQVVRKGSGYEGRVSTPIGDVVPYMDFDPLTGTFRPTEYGVSTGRMGPEGGYEVRYAQPIVPGQKVPPQISGQYRKQLDRNSSVEASGFYVPIPGMKDAYGANVRYVQRFADGGEVDYNQMAEQMTVGTVPEGKPGAAAQVAKDVVRGAQYLPYDLLGMPVDIATMAMRPFGYKTEKPFLGSEYLIDKAVQAGIADQPTGSLAETASRVGMGFVNPAAGARQVGRGIDTLRKGAETLELPGAAKTAPVGALFPKQNVDTAQLLPKENKPFIGEVERIVADLPGPVTKDQFLSQMRKQGRNYEVARVEQALYGWEGNAKFTPTELMERLKSTSPTRYTTEIIPPGTKHLYDTMDNPFPSIKPGAVNLLLDIPADQKQVMNLREQIGSVTDKLSPFMFLRPMMEARFGSETTAKPIQQTIDEIAPIIKDLAEFSGKKADDYLNPLRQIASDAEAIRDVNTALSNVNYPALTPAWKKFTEAPRNELPAELKDKYGYLDVNKLLIKIFDDGITDLRKSIDNAKDVYNIDQTPLNVFERKLSQWKKDPADFETIRRDLNKSAEGIAAQTQSASRALMDNTYVEIGRIDRLAQELPMPYFEGGHRAIVSRNPIGFSRFVEFTPNQADEIGISMPDQDRGAIMYLELQSDRLKALRNKYEVEEAFPNMAGSSKAVQQLLMKNAIYGGIKMNKGLVLFPGSDSAQAQLYEKLGSNLKQVVKDLGPGFTPREFKFPNENGQMTTRWGVYIDEDAAKRVLTQGMRFAKGGMVDKPLYDRAA